MRMNICSACLRLVLMLSFSVNLSAQQAERLTLLFVGDLMQHKGQIDAARTSSGYDYTECFARVRESISQADLAVGNLEVPLGGKPYTGYPCFSAPDDFQPALRDAGFDLLLTANNHCLDRGGRGLARTIHLLDSIGMPHTGTFLSAEEREQRYPLLICKKGFRIAFLNYTYGTNGITVQPPYVVNYIDREVMAEDIRRARSMNPDALFVCIHWGTEYQSLPNREQRELADWMLAQGVTHIIGTHPHVVQPMELRTDKRGRHIVAYSLGNFISNMSAPHTDGGAMLHVELAKIPSPPRFSPFGPTADRSTSLSADSTAGITQLKTLCYPHCCAYELVWTARPQVAPGSNYELQLVRNPSPSLPASARQLLERYAANERSLFHRHNIGIEERKAE